MMTNKMFNDTRKQELSFMIAISNAIHKVNSGITDDFVIRNLRIPDHLEFNDDNGWTEIRPVLDKKDWNRVIGIALVDMIPDNEDPEQLAWWNHRFIMLDNMEKGIEAARLSA